jgi:hypothetical protein
MTNTVAGGENAFEKDDSGMAIKILFRLRNSTAIVDFSSLFSRHFSLRSPLALITNKSARAQLCTHVDGLVVWRFRGAIVSCEMRANLMLRCTVHSYSSYS